MMPSIVRMCTLTPSRTHSHRVLGYWILEPLAFPSLPCRVALPMALIWRWSLLAALFWAARHAGCRNECREGFRFGSKADCVCTCSLGNVLVRSGRKPNRSKTRFSTSDQYVQVNRSQREVRIRLSPFPCEDSFNEVHRALSVPTPSFMYFCTAQRAGKQPVVNIICAHFVFFSTTNTGCPSLLFPGLLPSTPQPRFLSKTGGLIDITNSKRGA